MVGIDHLKGLFQPEQFHHSMPRSSQWPEEHLGCWKFCLWMEFTVSCLIQTKAAVEPWHIWVFATQTPISEVHLKWDLPGFGPRWAWSKEDQCSGAELWLWKGKGLQGGDPWVLEYRASPLSNAGSMVISDTCWDNSGVPAAACQPCSHLPLFNARVASLLLGVRGNITKSQCFQLQRPFESTAVLRAVEVVWAELVQSLFIPLLEMAESCPHALCQCPAVHRAAACQLSALNSSRV